MRNKTLLLSSFLFILPACSDILNFSENELDGFKVTLNCGTPINSEYSEPLWILNGKIVSSEFFDHIKIDYIDSISVLKHDHEVEQYGKSGENGVIKIYADKKIFTDLKPDTSLSN